MFSDRVKCRTKQQNMVKKIRFATTKIKQEKPSHLSHSFTAITFFLKQKYYFNCISVYQLLIFQKKKNKKSIFFQRADNKENVSELAKLLTDLLKRKDEKIREKILEDICYNVLNKVCAIFVTFFYLFHYILLAKKKKRINLKKLSDINCAVA